MQTSLYYILYGLTDVHIHDMSGNWIWRKVYSLLLVMIIRLINRRLPFIERTVIESAKTYID